MIQVVVLSGCVAGYIGLMAGAWWLDSRAYWTAGSAAWDRYAATAPEPADLAPDAAVEMGPAAIAVLVGEPWQAFHAVVSGLVATGKLERDVSYTGAPTLLWVLEEGPPEAGVEKAIWETHKAPEHLHANVNEPSPQKLRLPRLSEQGEQVIKQAREQF